MKNDKRSGPAGILVAALLLMVAVSASAQRDFSGVEMQTTQIDGAVHMLIGAGGNIGVSAGDDGVLIVDDQFAPLVPKIRAALSEISQGDLAFVLNTHFHFDHTGGNEAFGAEAVIVAHDNVRKRLSMEQSVGGNTTPPSPPVALPVVTFGDRLSIHFNGEEIRVQHFPNAHTDGDAVVHFVDSDVLHLGDLFFAGRFPFVDTNNGGSALGLLDAITKILEGLPDSTKLIPGHGPLSKKSDLRKYQEMLRSTIDTVRTAKDSGKSLEEIQKAGFDEEWAGWGSGFINGERWAAIIHASLE